MCMYTTYIRMHEMHVCVCVCVCTCARKWRERHGWCIGGKTTLEVACRSGVYVCVYIHVCSCICILRIYVCMKCMCVCVCVCVCVCDTHAYIQVFGSLQETTATKATFCFWNMIIYIPIHTHTHTCIHTGVRVTARYRRVQGRRSISGRRP